MRWDIIRNLSAHTYWKQNFIIGQVSSYIIPNSVKIGLEYQVICLNLELESMEEVSNTIWGWTAGVISPDAYI